MVELVQAKIGDEEETPQKSFHDEEPPKGKTFFSDEKGNLKFVNLVVRYPCAVFVFMISLCFLSAFVLRSLFDGTNPFTEDTNAYDIFDVRSIAYDSLKLATDEVNTLLEESGTTVRALSQDNPQAEVGDITYWIYEAKTEDGLFTKEAIPILRATEATILENENYPEYCKLDYTTTQSGETVSECMKPLSVMNIYYASTWNSTLAQEIIDALKDETNIAKYNALGVCVEYTIGCDLVPGNIGTSDNKAWVESMNLKITSMVDTWDGLGDLNPDIEQVTEFIAYMKELYTKAPLVNFFFDEGFNKTNRVASYSRSILYWGQLLEGTSDEDESSKKLKKFIIDNLYDDWTEITKPNNNPEVASYYFMIALIWDVILQILTVDGLKAIASFMAVFFYLRIMLGSWFLTAVGMFEIFMSIPLSWLFFSYVFQIKYFSTLNTICIFIVIAIGADDIFVFMDAYKQSATKGPEVLSSLESRMSYVYRRSGSAMLLTSATTCSAFLCTLASPIAGTRSFGIFAAFVILFDYILVMTLFCTSVVIYHNRFEGKPCCCNCTCWIMNDPTPTENALHDYDDGVMVETDRISTFFKEKLAPFILRGRNRIFIFVALISWLVVAAIFTSRLEPTRSAEQFLDDNHPIQKAGTILTEEFPKTQEDETSKIYYVWGLEEINRKGVNQLLDPEFVGEAAFDGDFSFNEDCQTKVLEACETLQSDAALEEFILRKDGQRSVDCFVLELGAYNYLDDQAACLERFSGTWKNETWQVSSDDLDSTMSDFVKAKTCRATNETMLDYYDANIGWDGNSLRYVGISVDSSLMDSRTINAEDVVRRHYDIFMEYAAKFDTSMQDVCQSKTIMTDLDQKFIFMNNQKIYRSSGILGSLLGVVIAFGVLLISTRKLHIAFFATLCILCVLISVIGYVTMLGWTLGTIEAILFSILAGFSVDYVIHLAHAYVHAEGDTEERLTEAFGEMGISVFSGMLTSVVASIPLFFCTLTFFAKFGTFLCLTIAMSWIFANFGFMSLLAQFKISMTKKWI